MRNAVAALGLAFAFATIAHAAPGSGTVTGTFSVGGKTIPLAHASAFRHQEQTVVVLSDKELPASTWKSSDDMATWRREHPFLGVAIWIDAASEIDRGEIYDGADYPTSVSGVFALKVERAADAVSGSLKSTAGAARLRKAVQIDVAFKVPLK